MKLPIDIEIALELYIQLYIYTYIFDHIIRTLLIHKGFMMPSASPRITCILSTAIHINGSVHSLVTIIAQIDSTFDTTAELTFFGAR